MPTIVTIDTVTMIHGDCMDPMVMQAVPDTIDLLLDDPPYLGLSGGIDDYARGGVTVMTSPTTTVGDLWGANWDWAEAYMPRITTGAVVWAGTAMLPEMLAMSWGDMMALGVWYKRNAMPSLRPVPKYSCEFYGAWKRGPGLDWRKFPTHLDVPKLAAGAMASERILMPGSGKALHPAQKPVAVMESILSICPPGTSVLDLHAGTGTVAAACMRHGLRCISIERDSTYFEAAVIRLEQQAKQPSLLIPSPQVRLCEQPALPVG
ncbi:MAG: site-specific DNA-methyltransferase [Magnetospirillum sp.]|nr:site-specific DNA-methyltransferase [Magnetospirillum sp.]